MAHMTITAHIAPSEQESSLALFGFRIIFCLGKVLNPGLKFYALIPINPIS